MTKNPWLVYALGSAFFAALTAILGKLGVSEINSNLATLIRTIVILVVTATLVSLRSEWQPLAKLSWFGLTMLVLSGIATGFSWLFYYRALQLGPASKVAPIDKLSIVLVMIMAVVFFGEALTWKLAVGVGLIAAGAILVVA